MGDIASQFGAPPVGDTMRRMGEGSPFAEANAALNLTPEEQALYIRHLQNLWGTGGVDNADGSRSSLFQMTAGPPGKPVQNVPTVWNGAILPPGAAMIAAGKDGPFPSYPTTKAAEQRYHEMHEFMGQDTEEYLRKKNPNFLPQFDIHNFGPPPAASPPSAIPPSDATANIPGSLSPGGPAPYGDTGIQRISPEEIAAILRRLRQ